MPYVVRKELIFPFRAEVLFPPETEGVEPSKAVISGKFRTLPPAVLDSKELKESTASELLKRVVVSFDDGICLEDDDKEITDVGAIIDVLETHDHYALMALQREYVHLARPALSPIKN